MKKSLTLVLLLMSMMFSLNAQEAYLGDALWSTLHNSRTDDTTLRIIMVMKDQVDPLLFDLNARAGHYSLQQRQQLLLRQLYARAAASQQELLPYINGWCVAHHAPDAGVRTFWLVNMMVLDARPELIWQLAGRSDIAWMDLDAAYLTGPVKPVSIVPDLSKEPGLAEPGLKVIHADFMWKKGYTGKNRISYSIDTGVWPGHPALRDRFLANFYPLSQCWFPYDSEEPADKTGSHGTHTLGTTLGLDPVTHDTVGAAFNAYWICSDPVATSLATVKPLSDFMYAFEFALNPDQDTSTFTDVPDVINNSWGYDVATDTTLCDSYVSQMFMTLAAAGIANVFSAGNSGPDSMTIGVPHHINTTLTNSFTVGAVNGNTSGYPIASFSSRGPSICGGSGSLLIKPEVSAPGVNVRSAYETNSYASLSGTSMAAPHVTGAVLLLKEAFPQVTGDEILYALYTTATDLGDPGEDNTYGMGLINTEAAFNYLSGIYTPVPPDSNAYDAEVSALLSPEGSFYCDTLLSPQFMLTNKGTVTITHGLVHYGFNGGATNIYEWNGSLAAGASETVTLPDLALSPVNQAEFSLWFESDTAMHETSVINNRRMARFHTRPRVDLPFMEDFEQGINPVTWYIHNPDNNETWDTAYAGGLLYSQRSAVMHFNDTLPVKQRDELFTPSFDLSGVDSAFLKFDLAYQCYQIVLADTLAIWVSDDCGLHFNDCVWKKWGINMQTYDTATANFVPSRADQWRTELVDLSAYAGNPEVLIRFTGSNKKGNNLYLDNIKVFSDLEPSSIQEHSGDNWKVYPNPVSDALYIENISGSDQKISLVIVNLQGAVCYRYEGELSRSARKTLELPDLRSGSYLLRIVDKGAAFNYKFMKIK